MKAAILQMTSGIDPLANARTLADGVARAAADGAAMLFTPEMSGLLDRKRERAAASIVNRRPTARCRTCARCWASSA